MEAPSSRGGKLFQVADATSSVALHLMKIYAIITLYDRQSGAPHPKLAACLVSCAHMIGLSFPAATRNARSALID